MSSFCLFTKNMNVEEAEDVEVTQEVSGEVKKKKKSSYGHGDAGRCMKSAAKNTYG